VYFQSVASGPQPASSGLQPASSGPQPASSATQVPSVFVRLPPEPTGILFWIGRAPTWVGRLGLARDWVGS